MQSNDMYCYQWDLGGHTGRGLRGQGLQGGHQQAAACDVEAQGSYLKPVDLGKRPKIGREIENFISSTKIQTLTAIQIVLGEFGPFLVKPEPFP